MTTYPFRRAGAVAMGVALLLAVLIASPRSVPRTNAVHEVFAPLVTEYQLGDMSFSGFYTIVTASDIEVHFHESGRSLDQVMGATNKSNCIDQRCPPAPSGFRLEMVDPTGKPLGNAWATSLVAAPVLGPQPSEFDFDITWPRAEAGRYRLIIGFEGLGEFEREIDVT